MTTDVVEGSKEPKEETQEQAMSTGDKEDAVVGKKKQTVTDVVEGSKEPKEETQEQAMSTVDKEDAVVGQEKQAVNESE